MTGDTPRPDERLTGKHRAAVTILAVVFILLSGATLVAAVDTDAKNYTEDWEEYGTGSNIESATGNEYTEGGSGGASIVSDTTYEGNRSLRLSQDNDRSVSVSGSTSENVEFELDSDTFRVTQRIHATDDFGGSSSVQGVYRLTLTSPTEGRQLRYGWQNSNNDGWKIWGPSGQTASGVQAVPDGDWFEMELVLDRQTNVATMYVDGTQVVQHTLSQDLDGSYYPRYFLNTEAGDETIAIDVHVDDVQMEGTQMVNGTQFPDSDDEDLRLDVPGYLPHNDSSSYSVEFNQSDGGWTDVTSQATVTPENTDALTFYDNGTVTAGGNKSINERVNVTAEYSTLQATDYTVVATPTVDNLYLLPAWWSVNAVLSDWTMVWILLATLIAAAASRIATTFAGIGAFVMAMVMGWIMGDVPDGIMVATIFMGLFIGLNLAANIDYSMR